MLIDTNVWSELTRPRPEGDVVEFLHTNRERLMLSTIVMAELEFGVANAPSIERRKRLAAFADEVLMRCGDRILRPDLDAAATWGKLKAELNATGEPIADMDLMIAAQAIAAGIPLATRNVSHMGRTGAWIINPWET